MRKKVLFLLFILISLISFSSCKKKEVETNEGRVYYEIFVRSFADSNGDGIGDFNGITQKLDYLSELGIKGIWLMPIFPSPSYHGYDVIDYNDVNKQYGTMKDFETLLNEAHKRDIKVIIDFVINHTSTQHPWFQSAKNETSEFRDYYRFKTKAEPKTGPWYPNSINGGSNTDQYYAYFWDQMPDLNFENPKVVKEMEDAADFWIEKGVDGFRFDAALHIFSPDELYNLDKVLLTANTDFWKDFRKRLKKLDPETYLVGEIWTSSSSVAPFYQGLDSNFNFDLADRIITTAKSNGNMYYSKQIETMLSTIKEYSQEGIDAPFLRNHDQTRLVTEVGNDLQIAKLTAEMLLTLKGNPFIYYGEELGMKGDKPDEDLRSPFLWTKDFSDLDTTWYRQKIDYNVDTPSLAEQIEDPNSIYHVYKTLISLRNEHKALAMGDFRYVKSNVSNLQMFLRISEKDEEAVLVVHNFSRNEYTANLNTENLNLIYQSISNENKNLNVFAPKSTKIFTVPFDEYNNYLE